MNYQNIKPPELFPGQVWDDISSRPGSYCFSTWIGIVEIQVYHTSKGEFGAALGDMRPGQFGSFKDYTEANAWVIEQLKSLNDILTEKLSNK